MAGTGGDRSSKPVAGNITLSGSSSGNASVGSIDACNLRTGYGSRRSAKITIRHYKNVTVGDITGTAVPGHRGINLEVCKGITGNIHLTGKLDLSSKDKNNKIDEKKNGYVKLTCGSTITLSQLDLNQVQRVLLDSGSGTSKIENKITGFSIQKATGKGTEDDPKISGETRLRAPAGQKVYYRYAPGEINDALGGHVWQLRGLKNKETGGLLVPGS